MYTYVVTDSQQIASELIKAIKCEKHTVCKNPMVLNNHWWNTNSCWTSVGDHTVTSENLYFESYIYQSEK